MNTLYNTIRLYTFRYNCILCIFFHGSHCLFYCVPIQFSHIVLLTFSLCFVCPTQTFKNSSEMSKYLRVKFSILFVCIFPFNCQCLNIITSLKQSTPGSKTPKYSKHLPDFTCGIQMLRASDPI